MNFDQPLQIGGATTAITTGAAAETVIPDLDSPAIKPKLILVIANGDLFFRPIQTGETPADASLMFLPADTPVVVNVVGFTHLRHLQGAAAEILYVTPLANEGGDETLP